MSAGSLQDTGTNFNGFVISINEPPVVEIDTVATAAYIRLRATKVARTKPFTSEQGLVMIDFDAEGNVVGIEVVGQQELSILELIKQLPPVNTKEEVLDRTPYVAASLRAA